MPSLFLSKIFYSSLTYVIKRHKKTSDYLYKMEYLEDFFDDTPNKKLLELLEKMIDTAVERALIKHGLLVKHKEPEIRFITIKDLCLELRVSKTAVYNWKKDKRIGSIVEAILQRKVTGYSVKLKALKNY